MAWPATLGGTYVDATNATGRSGRLAPQEVATHDLVDLIVSTLGEQVALLGGYATVKDRLAATTAATSGWRQAVRAASVGPITLASQVENGDTLDGVVLATGNRILLKDQVTQTENGPWVVAASGAPARPADFASGASFPGTTVQVVEGTRNKGSAWRNLNTGTPVLGTTAITYRKSEVGTPAYQVAASNATDRSKQYADFVCPGSADQDTFTVIAFLAVVAGGQGVTFSCSEGDFSFSAVFTALADATKFIGQGARATDFTSTSSTILFDFSGASSASHRYYCGTEKLRVRNTAGTTLPAIRSYYASHFTFKETEFASCLGGAQESLEIWDSVWTDCQWVDCGTQGVGQYNPAAPSSGGRPSLLFLGSITSSGFGSTNDNDNSLRFTDCMLHSWVDGGILFQGNTAGEFTVGTVESQPNKISFTNLKCESGKAGYGPALRFYRTRVLSLVNIDVTVGPNFAGGATAQDYVEFVSCSGVRWSGANLERTHANPNTRSFVYVDGGSCFSFRDFYVQLNAATGAATVAIIDYANAPSKVYRSNLMFWYDATSGAVPMEANTSVLTGHVENRGTDTIAVAATSVVITHKMFRTPQSGEIMVTAASKPSGNDPGHIWISAVGATTFTINCAVAPTGSALTVHWRAECPIA